MLAVEEAGEGPVVIGLHGLTATRRYVLMGSRALERSGHRVVLYDARGHGESDPAERYDYASLAADLLGLMDEREIERATLAGASMGAHTAVRFALEHPARVAGLVLLTPAYDPANHPSGLDEWDALAAGLREGGVEGFVAAYDIDKVPERWRDTVLTVIRQRLSAHRHPLAVADAIEQVPRSHPFAAWEELAAITAPTVVIASRDEADPGHPLATANAYADAIPGARLLVEDPGASPLAWQGGRISREIANL
jgi:pimeloyl-ACP methyl ester carboxylesterase